MSDKMKVKRNDPCPCGSGEKYKKCCLPKEEPAIDLRLRRYKDTDIQLNKKLMKFATDSLSEEEKEDTFSYFFIPDEFDEIFGNVEVDEDLEDVENAMKSLYFPWLLYDYRTEQNATFTEMYWEKMGNKLDEFEKDLIKGYIASFPSYYQVLEVREGVGLNLKDIITNEEFFVNDISSSHQAVKWDILYARIVKASQYHILAGNCILFPPLFKQDIKEFMTGIFEKTKRLLKGISYRDFQKNFASLNNYLVLILMRRLVLKPKFTNFDGEELILSEAYYEVIDVPKLVSKLNGVKHFEVVEISKDKNGQIVKADLNWFRRGKKRKDNISLGSLQIEEGKLTVFCNSRERLQKIKEILARNCQDLLKYKATTYKDTISLLKEAKQKPTRPKQDEIPIETQKQIIEQLQSEYQEEWLNSSIPALGGLTPKQASRTKKGRRLLEELLNSFENRQLRREKQTKERDKLLPPILDVRQIRKELGLS